MSGLLPCPFCGRLPTIETQGPFDRIRCPTADCSVKSCILYRNRETMVERWNRRTLDPVLVAAIRETALWIDHTSYVAGMAAEKEDWAAHSYLADDSVVALAVLDRLLSGAE